MKCPTCGGPIHPPKLDRKAFDFFYKNAGYAVGQRAIGAAQLARAEALAKHLGYSWETEWDEDADLSWMSDAERAEEHEVIGVILKDSHGNVLQSLWNIVDPDSAYLRTVNAELALEAFS